MPGRHPAVFDHAVKHGVGHVVFVGRHTYYGAAPESPLYHSEDQPPQGVGSYPELGDLIAADLLASNMLWREPSLITTVPRLVYTLGPSRQGTLAGFLKGSRVPMVMGYDPLFHYLEVRAITLAVEKELRGVFVAGPPPRPLGNIITETAHVGDAAGGGAAAAAGPLRFPNLPAGRRTHQIPHRGGRPVFREATGFQYEVDEVDVLRRFRAAGTWGPLLPGLARRRACSFASASASRRAPSASGPSLALPGRRSGTGPGARRVPRCRRGRR